jgi:16S rRNA C1402 N4-methylase RsmH
MTDRDEREAGSFKAVVTIKQTNLIVTTTRPASKTKEGARREGQRVKEVLRDMGISNPQLQISSVRRG